MKTGFSSNLLTLVAAGLLSAACASAPPPPPPGIATTTTTTTTAMVPAAPPVTIIPLAAMAVPPSPLPSAADMSDTLAVLASDFAFGPSMEDADVTARYYCSVKGKLPQFMRRDNPPELRAPPLLAGFTPTYTVMMYRCVTPAR